MAVYAAVGQKPRDVELFARVARREHGLLVGLVFKEAAVGHGVGDPGQVLVDHAARADVGVADLAVAHLPLGQTHGEPRGLELGVRALGKEPVQIRCVRAGDGVGLARRSQAEAVHDE